MSTTITITLSPQAQKLLANAQAFPVNLLKSIQRAMDAELGLAAGHIMSRRLTGKGPFPVAAGRLGTRTNRLRNSVWAAPARIHGNVVSASIGSNVKYAGVHEFGFTGTVQVKAHKRRIIALDRYERAGRGWRQTQSGIRGTIRAHSMRLSIPARAPFRRGLEDRVPNLSRALSRAIVEAFNPPAAGAAPSAS